MKKESSHKTLKEYLWRWTKPEWTCLLRDGRNNIIASLEFESDVATIVALHNAAITEVYNNGKTDGITSK